MISRVNMDIVGAHAMMANGGGYIYKNSWSQHGCPAARKHAVPFVVLAGSHKVCELYPHNPEVSPFFKLSVNPTFDYVAPNFVSRFITEREDTTHLTWIVPLEIKSLGIELGFFTRRANLVGGFLPLKGACFELFVS
ncbi:hypothetical protein Bca4012_055462 [Brassica carinata]